MEVKMATQEELDKKDLEMKELTDKLITGVSEVVVKRISDENKDKYVDKSELKQFQDAMEKRLNGGFGRIDTKDRKDMLPFVHDYFLREIMGLKNVKTAGAWDSATSGAASELIPSEIGTILIEKLNMYSLLRQNCTIYPSDKGTLPVEATAATAARVTTRGTPVSASSATYTPVTYATMGMQSWMVVDNKVARESPARVFDMITTILIKSFAALEYTEFITGAGTTEMEGLNTASITTSTPAAHSTIATLDAIDTEAWFRLLPAAYRMAGLNATWAIGGTTLASQLASLNATGGKEYWNANAAPETWHGRRYWEHASVTTSGTTHPVGYFGDLAYYYIFDKMGQVLKRTDVGYTLTLSDQTLIAVYGETDGCVVLPDAFRSLTLHA
jgi:HK97 family phage major capsid protein